jgi:hypothetical protein
MTSVPQQYTLRIQPQSFQKIKLQRYNFQQSLSEALLELSLEKQASIKEKYTTLIDLYSSALKLQILDTTELILQDAIQVYKKKISAGSVDDIAILTDIETDMFDIQIKKLDINSVINEKLNLITQWLDQPTQSINFSKIISIENIHKEITKGDQDNANSNIDLLLKEKKIESSLMKKKMIQVENRNIINNFQLRYTDSVSRGDADYKQWSAGISFNIPFPNENKLKVQNAHLDYLESIKNYEKEKEKTNKELKLLMYKISSNIILQKQYQALISDFNQKYSITDLTNNGYKDIKTLYKMRIKSIDLDNKKIAIQNEILNLWIEYCDKKGDLSFKNCLEN